MLVPDSALERTIDKTLDQIKNEILSGLKGSLDEARDIMDGSLQRLEQEYERLVSDGRKEADKLEKQIVGSSDLEARNRQLVLVEESVEKVFDHATRKIREAERDGSYSAMISAMLDEAASILRTTQITVLTSSQDRGMVKSSLSNMPDAQLSTEEITCMGGIVAKSRDGSMTFDNTIDARLERMKPLIRKEIASKFGIGG